MKVLQGGTSYHDKVRIRLARESDDGITAFRKSDVPLRITLGKASPGCIGNVACCANAKLQQDCIEGR